MLTVESSMKGPPVFTVQSLCCACEVLVWLISEQNSSVYVCFFNLSMAHLEYWASVQVSEQHLGLCREFGRFFRHWLQRGRHSNPGWIFYHLKNVGITLDGWWFASQLRTQYVVMDCSHNPPSVDLCQRGRSKWDTDTPHQTRRDILE